MDVVKIETVADSLIFDNNDVIRITSGVSHSAIDIGFVSDVSGEKNTPLLEQNLQMNHCLV
jgi:hypothetical protein